jgi:sulfhydrogenase subunit beta (sulfur reductase)
MKLTDRTNLRNWLDALAERYTLIAPRWEAGDLLYQKVTGSQEIAFDYERTVLSPKTFLLPDTQTLLEIKKRAEVVELVEPPPEEEQVLFGIRPCDARGLRVLDALLLGRSPADADYAARRARTTLIGLACPQLWEDCFCTSLGGAPDDATDMDLMLYASGDEYWVQVVTEKGGALLEWLSARDTDRPAPVSARSGTEVPVLPPEGWAALFDDAYWRRLGDRCLSCRACTYVCPTCRCFDVRDTTVAAGPGTAHIERLRAWDSCLAAAYRRIAGGHNPRPTVAQRLRNRFYCKFYYSPEGFDVVACVGCGRCIAVCPAGIDISEMLAEVSALAAQS